MSEKKGAKVDRALIEVVQQARMAFDAEARPSQVAGVYWIEARRSEGEYPEPTARAGQWVIETTVREVDALWAVIKQATEEGKLGYKAKVSTSPGPGQQDPQARLIYVRTYDAADAADVARVGEALRVLGVMGEIRYEADAAIR